MKFLNLKTTGMAKNMRDYITTPYFFINVTKNDSKYLTKVNKNLTLC